MNIKALNSISSEAIAQIKTLEDICKVQDGLKSDMDFDTSYNFNKEMNTLFLAYEENELIGVLKMFVPTPVEAEISGYTKPDYRLRGSFRKLVDAAVTELKKYNVPDILFVAESQVEVAKAVINKFKGSYDFTEYVLSYNHSLDDEIKERNYRLQMVKAGMADVEMLIPISVNVFHDSYKGAETLLLNAISSDNRAMYSFLLGDKCIGMAGICLQDGEASLFGIGILPEYQGKGYGKELLYLLIKSLLQKNIHKITLEVNSENKAAYELYTKSGFEIQTAVDYYRKTV